MLPLLWSMGSVRTLLLLSLALFTISAAYSSSSPTLPQGSEATITIASEIFIVNPANIILDGTTIRPGSAGVSVDGQIVSADAANDLFVDGSEVLAGTTVANTSISKNITAGSTFTSSATSLGSSSLQWSTGSTGSISNNTAHIVVNGVSSATVTASFPLNSTATIPIISGLNSVPTSLSTNSITSQPVVVASAAASSSSSSSSSTSAISGFTKTNVLSAGPDANFRSPSQPISSASISLSASSNQTRTESSSALINNSTGQYNPFGASTQSQSVSFQSRNISSSFSGSAISASSPVVSVQGSATQPSTITSGPSIVIPTVSWNPTGSAASSQAMLIYRLIFDITDEAKTLSSIVIDDGPKESFANKIKGADDEVFQLFEDLDPRGPPPSYDDSCLDGADIFDIVKDLGCLKSGFDEVVDLLEAEPPDVTQIQSILDNLGTLANNLKEEEDDDDDDRNSTDENETKTPTSVEKSPSTSFSGLSSISSSASLTTSSRISSEMSRSSIRTNSSHPISASSRSSSSSTRASSTLTSSSSVFSSAAAGLDTSPVFDYNLTGDGTPDISDQAALAFFGDLLSSAMGIGPGLSGFTTSTTVRNATLTTTSQPQSAETSSLAIALISELVIALSNVHIQKSSTLPGTSDAPKVATSTGKSTSTAGKGGHPTSSIIPPAPITTHLPTTTSPIVPLSINIIYPLECTQLEEVLQGGKDPYYIHTCTCNDGSKPTATPSGDAFVCPSQVAVVIEGR